MAVWHMFKKPKNLSYNKFFQESLTIIVYIAHQKGLTETFVGSKTNQELCWQKSC